MEAGCKTEGKNELSKPTTIAGFGSPSQCAQLAVGPFADLTIIPRQRSFLTPWAERLSMFLFFCHRLHMFTFDKSKEEIFKRQIKTCEVAM